MWVRRVEFVVVVDIWLNFGSIGFVYFCVCFFCGGRGGISGGDFVMSCGIIEIKSEHMPKISQPKEITD